MKKFALGLLIVSVLAASCLAQGPHVFMGIYWVRGAMVKDDPGIPDPSLGGRTAILFPSTGDPLNEDRRVETTTDGDGNFILNPFYNEHLPIVLDPDYYSAAVLRQHLIVDPPDTEYGADPVSFGLDARGWNEVTLTLAEDAGPGEVGLVDDGIIRETNIRLDGDNVVISWTYNPLPDPLPAQVAIYMQNNGTGSEYDRTGAWGVQMAARAVGGRIVEEYPHVGAAPNNNNYYYRVVACDGLGDPMLAGEFDGDNNSITVGKVAVALPENEYVFTALPFMEDVNSLADLLGDQLPLESEFLWWNGAAYPGATYSESGGIRRWTGTNRDLRIGEGFLLRAASDSSLAMVGRFGSLDVPYVRTLPRFPVYNLISCPAPTSRTIEDMGVTLNAGDDLYEWTGSGFPGATYNVGRGWIGLAGIDTFGLTAAKFYRTQPGIDWMISFPVFP